MRIDVLYLGSVDTSWFGVTSLSTSPGLVSGILASLFWARDDSCTSADWKHNIREDNVFFGEEEKRCCAQHPGDNIFIVLCLTKAE